MSKNKISKDTAIKLIIDDLKKNVDKRIIIDNLRMDWNFSKASFYNWYPIAEKEYLKFHEKVEAKQIEKIAKADTSKILSKLDRMILLSKFAKGEIKITKQVVTKYGVTETLEEVSIAERRNSIAELNRMDGAYNKALLEYEKEKQALSNIDESDEFNGFELEQI